MRNTNYVDKTIKYCGCDFSFSKFDTFLFFSSFLQIRLSYHTLSSSLTPGPLDLVVNFVKESSDGKVTLDKIHLTLDVPMRNNRDGWIRWEAALPENMQQR